MKKKVLFSVLLISVIFLVGKCFALNPEGYETWKKIVSVSYSSGTLGTIPMGTTHYLVIDENGKIGFVSSSDTAKVTIYQSADFSVVIDSTSDKITVYQSAPFTVVIDTTTDSILIYASSETAKVTTYQSAALVVTIDSTTHKVEAYQGNSPWSVNTPQVKDQVSASTPTIYQGGTDWSVSDADITNKVSKSTPTVYPGATFPISTPINLTVILGSGTLTEITNTISANILNSLNVWITSGTITSITDTVNTLVTNALNVWVTSGNITVAISSSTHSILTYQDGAWVISAIDLDIRNLSSTSDSVNVTGSTVNINGTVPVSVSGTVNTTGSTVTVNGSVAAVVSATDLDIRNLSSATDSVDTTGSTVTVKGNITATISGAVDTTGSTVTVNGNVTATISGTVDTTGSTVTVNGTVGVTATDLDVRNLVFATDKVDVGGSTITVTLPISTYLGTSSDIAVGTTTAVLAFSADTTRTEWTLTNESETYAIYYASYSITTTADGAKIRASGSCNDKEWIYQGEIYILGQAGGSGITISKAEKRK